MKRILYTLLGIMLSTGAWAQTSLQEQINSAEAGSTVTLSGDVTLEARVDINKNLTVDLGGHTITTTATCGNGSAFNIVSGTVTIQNGTIDASFGEANSGETDAITARTGSDVTLKDLNITVNSRNGACAYAFDGSKITIKSGHYENQTTETYQYNANITAMVVNQANVATQLIFIEGGTFKGYDPTLGDDSQTTNENATFLAEGVALQKDASDNYVTTTAVSKIGGKNYASLADAVAAVPADGTETTIKMLADVDLTATVTTVYGQNMILDLNNHNITSTVLAIKNLGDLEVTGTGSITVNGTKNTLYGISNAGAAGKKANLIIGENVTVTAPCVAILTSYGKTIVNGTLANKQADVSNIYSTLYLSQTSSEVIVAESAKVTGVVNAIYGAKGTLEVNSTNVGKIYADGSATQGLKIKKTAAIESLNVYGHAEFSDNSDYYVAAKAISACTGTVKLLSDINAALAVSANKTVTLDLNGHKVTAETTPIKVEGNLTITGEGTAQSTGMGSSTAVQAAAYVLKNGKLTILSGNYVAGFEGAEGNPAVYVRDNAVVEIKGGDFVGGSKFLLNKLDAYSETSTIEVTGGTFHNNFDPANNTNDGGSESYGTNYVADGYITEMTESGSDKIYTVKEGQWIAKIEGGVDSKFRFATLDDAITAANGTGKDVTIKLLADATATEDPASNVTIDAASHALTLPTFNVTDGAELSYAKVTNATDNTYNVTTATYNRTGAAGTQWGTVCLPFSFESAPTGYTLYTPTAVATNELTVTEVTYPVAAGTPVIFHKSSAAETTMTMTSSDAKVKIGATPLAQAGTLALVGTFSQEKIESGLESIYFINGDYFHQAKASLTVPAYRAYIKNTAAGAKPSILSIFVGGEATGVEKVSMENESVEGIYDVNGMKLSAPKKGMNIMKLANGKTVKLIVK